METKQFDRFYCCICGKREVSMLLRVCYDRGKLATLNFYDDIGVFVCVKCRDEFNGYNYATKFDRKQISRVLFT